MRLPLALFALGIFGCHERSESSPAPSAARVVAPSASAVSVPSAVPSPVAPPPPTERCKALDKGKLVAIGSHGGIASGITAKNGKVYVFAYEGARASLLAMPRDGSKATVVGTAMLANNPLQLRVDERAAYFLSGKKLYSMSLTGDGKAVEHEKDLAPALAVDGDSVYAMRCGDPDVLLKIPRTGGEAKPVAEFPRKPGTKCDYQSVAVDAKTAFVGDWSSRRIYSVDLGSGTLGTVVEKQAFLGSIAVGKEQLEFQASTGILRAPRTGGTATNITSYGATPFESIVWDERDFYVLHTEAYAVRDTLVRIPRAGGKLEELEFWKVSDVTTGGGRAGVALDEQCVYVAQNGNGFLKVLARRKP